MEQCHTAYMHARCRFWMAETSSATLPNTLVVEARGSEVVVEAEEISGVVGGKISAGSVLQCSLTVWSAFVGCCG